MLLDWDSDKLSMVLMNFLVKNTISDSAVFNIISLQQK